MRLLLFNPETEYALASGASFYTPPASVEKLRKANQLLPERWAEDSDVILVDNASVLQSRFRLVDWDGLSAIMSENSDIEIEPWGWNHALIRKLIDYGVPETKVPDKLKMDMIRNLAHRRTTVTLNSMWNSRIDRCMHVDVPQEINSEEECIKFLRSHHGCWMKAPWSSSGRGVINTDADMTEELVGQWCHGIIRRQGSVLVETGADNIADFATEWKIKGGVAKFLGVSSFSTSRRGKYLSNKVLSQERLRAEFNEICRLPIDQVMAIQKEIIEVVFAAYEGLLGVDMMVEKDGHLRPFVEVNLRRTMGMLYIMP